MSSDAEPLSRHPGPKETGRDAGAPASRDPTRLADTGRTAEIVARRSGIEVPRRPRSQGSRSTGERRILIVDDESAIRLVCRVNLDSVVRDDRGGGWRKPRSRAPTRAAGSSSCSTSCSPGSTGGRSPGSRAARDARHPDRVPHRARELIRTSSATLSAWAIHISKPFDPRGLAATVTVTSCGAARRARQDAPRVGAFGSIEDIPRQPRPPRSPRPAIPPSFDCERLRRAKRLVDRGEHHVREQLGVVGVDRLGRILISLISKRAGRLDGDHSAAGRGLDRLVGELLLRLRHLRLHLLHLPVISLFMSIDISRFPPRLRGRRMCPSRTGTISSSRRARPPRDGSSSPPFSPTAKSSASLRPVTS